MRFSSKRKLVNKSIEPYRNHKIHRLYSEKNRTNALNKTKKIEQITRWLDHYIIITEPTYCAKILIPWIS